MARIVTRKEAMRAGSRIRRVIGDTHCDMALQKIIETCDQNVVDAIDKKLSGSKFKSTKVYFEKEGKYYHIYKGLNGTLLPRKYTYNVFQYINENMAINNSQQRHYYIKEDKISQKTKEALSTGNHLDGAFNERYNINKDNRKKISKELGYLINNCYLEDDLHVIEDYNANIDKQRISFDALFEYGLMGSIETAAFVVCNANSGLSEKDYMVLLDPDMVALAERIRDNQEIINISFSARARKEYYPMFKWHERKFCKKDFISFLKDKLKCNDMEKIYIWLSKHFAMRDLFYYHSHALNMKQWKKSCLKVTKKDRLPHQDATIKEIKHAMERGKPILLAMGINTWLEYLPELKKYKKTFVLQCRSWLTQNNILFYKDYESLPKKRMKGEQTLYSNAWKLFKKLLAEQIESGEEK